MNRLANESSLYLRQHANNPVDWYPWGPEALARAVELNRPIFLSVGYSACHWCHVMEHESFEDAATAAVLNAHFVSIKLDREERPDLDAIYMNAVQLLNEGQGGWPMSVFLTPDLRPFYAGTYFPPRDNYGRPSFRRVLLALADAWQTRQPEVLEAAGNITGHLGRLAAVTIPPDPTLSDELLRAAVRGLGRGFDPQHGGFGREPKFPHAMDLRVLLRCWQRFGDDHALRMVTLTLDKMARGGMYDHLGGGFHRYSVDRVWLVPHFEKMLYDNALLPLAYLEGWQATGHAFYRQVVEETLDYVTREMTSPPGGFYSTQDADSEGEEGKFFVWTLAEVEQVLGAEAAWFAQVFDVRADGNWEGHNILHRDRSDEQDAARLNLSVAEFRSRVATARAKLLAVRDQRIKPGRDEKILTAWNGWMITAFARAGAALGRADYVTTAERAAEFVLTRLRTADGRLLRTCAADGPGKLPAYLEDYAGMIDALTALYEATFAARWLSAATALAEQMGQLFADATGPGLFFTAHDAEATLVRTKDTHDGSTPSGNALATTALLRLAVLTGRAEFRTQAEAILRGFVGVLREQPTAAGQMLLALDFYLGPVPEVAVVGPLTGAEGHAVLALLRQAFRPRQVLAAHDPANGPAPASVPLLAGKVGTAEVQTYVCVNYACAAPLTGVEPVRQLVRNGG
jgi:hypothetical protein